MALLTLEQVLAATSGQLLVSGPAIRFSGVSTDTRTLQPGDLFVAIRGERFNGHEFLDAAKQAGASGALIQEAIPGVRRRVTVPGPWTLIEVTDTLYALGQLARAHRRRFRIPVIGITGSAGKTTTKEMLAAILACNRSVLKSQGNFNNEIGMPLTLLGLDEAHQAAVLEFGMRGRGQIGYLAALALPTVGVITNIGLTHLELLGSPEEIALAKAELLDQMSEKALAILPGDDAFLPLLRDHARGPVITFGLAEGCDVWASDACLGDDGGMRARLHTPSEEIAIQLGAPGRHQLLNGLAAAAAALAVGATADDVRAGLAGYRPTSGRMYTCRALRGFLVVDDTYNANPAAMRATLDFLAEVPGGRKAAILGDMRELGPDARALHREIGRYAEELGIDLLLAVGELGREYVTGAGEVHAHWCDSNAAAAAAALAWLAPGDVVLVKGSRAMQMEEIARALQGSA